MGPDAMLHSNRKIPKIFHVNWFRTNEAGHFIWPGFGENCSVLEWILRRCDDEDVANVSPIGYIPKPDSINIDGIGELDMEKLFEISKDYWLEECENLGKYYQEKLGEDLPQAVRDELKALEERLKAA